MTSMLRTMIVEDENMFAEMLGLLMRSFSGIKLEMIAPSIRDAVAHAKASPPDLVILDLGLRDGFGIECIPQLVQQNEDVRIIVLSSHAETFTCPPGLLRYVCSTIDKSSAYDLLQKEIAKILSEVGEVAGHIDIGTLTNREAEILGLIGQGMTNREISEKLARSVETINTHRKNICQKLKVSGPHLYFLARSQFEKGATVDAVPGAAKQ